MTYCRGQLNNLLKTPTKSRSIKQLPLEKILRSMRSVSPRCYQTQRDRGWGCWDNNYPKNRSTTIPEMLWVSHECIQVMYSLHAAFDFSWAHNSDWMLTWDSIMVLTCMGRSQHSGFTSNTIFVKNDHAGKGSDTTDYMFSHAEARWVHCNWHKHV